MCNESFVCDNHDIGIIDGVRKKYAEYLNYHYLNLYRIEKYFVVPLNRKIKKYSNIIIQEDDNFSYLPK